MGKRTPFNAAEPLAYGDRVQNACSFSLPDQKNGFDAFFQDLPGGSAALPEVYARRYEEMKRGAPEALQALFVPRGRGKSAASPLAQYHMFYRAYSRASVKKLLSERPSREKLLHISLVLGLSCDTAEELLKRAGHRPLYAANLFELCIWYTLHTGGSLPELYRLYTRAADFVEQEAVRLQEAGADGPYTEGASRSKVMTSLFLEKRMQLLGSGDALRDDAFFDFLRDFAPNFRFHQDCMEEEYQYARSMIEGKQAVLGETLHAADPSLPVSAGASAVFDYFLPCTTWDYDAFYETTRLFGEKSHYKYPTREFLLLVSVYQSLFSAYCNTEYRIPGGGAPLTYRQLNEKLARDWNYPQLNRRVPFDAFLLELLRYLPEEPQYRMVARLLPLYQFVSDCKSGGALTEGQIEKLAGAFDDLLAVGGTGRYREPFVNTAAFFGRGRRTLLIGEEALVYPPHRGLLLLLKVLEGAVCRDGLLPGEAEVNRLLRAFLLPELRAGSAFDRFLLPLLGKPWGEVRVLLQPFFWFLLSFARERETGDGMTGAQAFATVFHDYLDDTGSAYPRFSQAAGVVLTAMGEYCGEPPRLRLLDCQIGVQAVFSDLRIRVESPDGTEQVTMEIVGQEKYGPRHGKAAVKAWVSAYRNLHFGQYTVRISGLGEEPYAFPVQLTIDRPSRLWRVSVQNGAPTAEELAP